jgi:hypothetical protein
MMIDPGQLQQPKPRGGMFGGGGDWKQALAAALGAWSAARGNPAGQMALQMLNQRLGQKREDQQYEQRRQHALEDWKAQQQWKFEHPEAANNDTVNDYNFIAGKLGEDAAKKYLQNLGDPMVTTVLPGNRVYSGPRSGLGSALGAPAPSLQPGHEEDGFRFKGGNPADPNAWEQVGQGGPRPIGVGGFPGSF